MQQDKKVFWNCAVMRWVFRAPKSSDNAALFFLLVIHWDGKFRAFPVYTTSSDQAVAYTCESCQLTNWLYDEARNHHDWPDIAITSQTSINHVSVSICHALVTSKKWDGDRGYKLRNFQSFIKVFRLNKKKTSSQQRRVVLAFANSWPIHSRILPCHSSDGCNSAQSFKQTIRR